MDSISELEGLVDELRRVRERGLLRLPVERIPRLVQCARESGVGAAGSPVGALVVELLREAVGRLDGDLRRAAELTLGTTPALLDKPAQERRKWAAAVYRQSTETFRREREIRIIAHVAEQILVFRAERIGNDGRAEVPVELDEEAVVPGLPQMGSVQRLVLPAPGRSISLTLRRGHAQTLRGIDIILSSENIYLEMAKSYRSSLSSSLRNAAARRSPSGDVIDDVLPRELNDWQRRQGRLGIPVAAGTVVPTSSGELSRQGIRRIYHAAVSVPEPESEDYFVEPGAITRAIRGAFDLARHEREQLDTSLRTICVPLLGAGRAGLSPQVAFDYLWPALEEELRAHDGWDVHLITRSARGALAAANGLSHRGASPAPAGPAP